MRFTTRAFLCAFTAVTTLIVAACGGSTLGSGTASASSASSIPVVTVSGNNAATLVVDGGPAGLINESIIDESFVSVTFCSPGTSNCVTVDHILVDTGSTGLRVMASLLPGLNLPAAVNTASTPLYDCVQFVDGYSWGSLKTADVQIAGEQANNLTVQVIDDASPSTGPAAPRSCSDGMPSENSVTNFGANGVLGIATFKEDCADCDTFAQPGYYYTCTATPCVSTTVTLAQEVQNPVYSFATDNNGVILELPSVGSAGAPSAQGVLIFGIDTESNNQLGSATVLTVDPTTGNFSTSYNSQTYDQSFIDSGSNGYFFQDNTLTQCTSSFDAGFYCPASTQTLTATITSFTGISSTVDFDVANAEQLTNNHPTYTAFSNLGGTISLSDTFDWGLPFFFGRNVYVAFDGQTTSAGTGPFIAY